MASYTETKRKTVEELIDKYTAGTLDIYVRATIKDAATTKMDEGASAISVADAVFDCIDKEFSGDSCMATVCRQICPKNVLLVLRSELITALK